MKLFAVFALSVALAGCASCPSPTETRGDLANDGSAHLRLTLRANVLAQTNERPATLIVSWVDPLALELVVKDATDQVRLRHAVAASGAPLSLALAGEDGKPLPEGIYRVEATAPGERASASFEIRHCTVYY